MAVSHPPVLLDELTDFLASSPTPQQIIAFRPSDSLQAHASELLQKNREDRLTAQEKAEMEEFMRMEHFMTLLKAKARLKLDNQG
jgi:hypothetical protein